MPEELLFESETAMSRGEIASYLRTVADRLETGESVTLTAGDQEVTLSPSERPTFEVTAEREGPADGAGELSLEFELEWPEGAGGGEAGLDIR